MTSNTRTYFALAVTVYFARNPGEVLTARDIRVKFGDLNKHSAASGLRGVLRNGTLAAWREPGIGRVYGAGPLLRALIEGEH